MNKLIKFIAIISFLALGWIAGGITVDYFNDDTCAIQSDMDYYKACSKGCYDMQSIYEDRYNINYSLELQLECSDVCFIE